MLFEGGLVFIFYSFPTCSTLLSISSSSSASRSARPPPAPPCGPPCCSSWSALSKIKKRPGLGRGFQDFGGRAPLWLSSAVLWQCQALESAGPVAFAHWQWQEGRTAQKCWSIKDVFAIFAFKLIDFGVKYLYLENTVQLCQHQLFHWYLILQAKVCQL